MATTYQDVLDFWFKELSSKDWFNGPDRVDHAIESRFRETVEAVYSGQHDDWLQSAQGRLAAILTLDQFPRNLYRRQPRSFSYDDKALKWCLDGIARDEDSHLEPIQRVFFYLPLEHSEKMENQDLSLQKYSALVTSVEPDEREQFRVFLNYAWRHYEIVKRFGRYPHRNDVLGRVSTGKELKFLEQPGSSFL